VITEEPGATTVALSVYILFSETTAGVAEEYEKVPGVSEVGGVRLKIASPYAFVTFVQLRVGVNKSRPKNVTDVLVIV